MAASDRMYNLASKRVTKWSQTRLPRGWFGFQVVAGAVILGWIGWGIITGDSTGASVPVAQAPEVAGVTGQVNEPATTTDPTTPASADEPTTSDQPSTPAGDPGSTVVSDVSGGAVEVPAGAAEVATAGLRGMFDSAAAALVPVAGGGTMPAPVRDFPSATIGTLTLVEQSEDGQRYTFVATTDADGEGATFSGVATQIVAVTEGGTWLIDRG